MAAIADLVVKLQLNGWEESLPLTLILSQKDGNFWRIESPLWRLLAHQRVGQCAKEADYGAGHYFLNCWDSEGRAFNLAWVAKDGWLKKGDVNIANPANAHGKKIYQNGKTTFYLKGWR